MPETIQIPRAWLEKLVEVNNRASKSEDPNDEIKWTAYLFGYIESAKSLLDK